MDQLLPRSIHMQFTTVHASNDRSAIESVAAYMEGGNGGSRGDGISISAVRAYLLATGQHKDKSRVTQSEFFCRGSLLQERVWKELDRSFRTKAGLYSTRGGNRCRRGQDHRSGGRARLAIFGDVSLPRELSEEAKREAGRRLCTYLRDEYGCAVLLVFHKKNGFIDHFHVLISTKPVDEGGVGTHVIRAFNGIASKCSGNRAEDGTRVAGFVENARQTFANILTEMTSIPYEWRSFKRQGRKDKPVPWIPRKKLEQEKRDGTFTSMQERKRLLAQRAAEHAAAAHKTERKAASTDEGIVVSNAIGAPSAVNPILEIFGKIGTETKTPITPQRTTSRVSSRALSEARTAEEIAAIIAADVHADAKVDAVAFAQEQKAAEAKRLANLLDGLPAPGTSWFGVSSRKTTEELAPRLHRPRRVKDGASVEPKTQIPIDDPASIPIAPFDRPFEDDEETAERKRKQNADNAVTSDRADTDRVQTPSVAPSQKVPGSRPMTKPFFATVEEGHVIGRLIPRKAPSAALEADPRTNDVDAAALRQTERQTKTGASARQKNAGLNSASKLSRKENDKLSSREAMGMHGAELAPIEAIPSRSDVSTPSPALKAACVEIASVHLRLHLRYYWLAELCIIAGMDEHTFRIAVNEQTTISRAIPLDTLLDRIGVLSKKFNQLAKYTRAPRSRAEGVARDLRQSMTSSASPKKDGRGS